MAEVYSSNFNYLFIIAIYWGIRVYPVSHFSGVYGIPCSRPEFVPQNISELFAIG